MDYNEMLSRLAARCATTELCAADVRRKLDATDLSDKEKERLLNRLIEEGYVDESRYARAFVRDKFRFSGWGRVKIAQGLRAKQISSSDIQDALTEIDEDDYRHALSEALESKRRTLRGLSEYETNARLIRFALSRGYEMDVIRKALRVDGFDMD